MSVPMAEKIARLDSLCAQARILPVITVRQAAHILPLADALAAGGLRTLEITLRSTHGLAAIRILRRERPQLCIGVGTVLDARMLAEAESAGAQFAVSPGCTAELLQAGLESPLPLLPGAGSASDLMLGHSLGYRRFKLFPAEICGGVAALQAFAGPFPGIRFCPTGGVRAENLREYMAQPNVMCVGGSWMLDSAALERGDWATAERLAAEAVALLG